MYILMWYAGVICYAENVSLVAQSMIYTTILINIVNILI